VQATYAAFVLLVALRGIRLKRANQSQLRAMESEKGYRPACTLILYKQTAESQYIGFLFGCFVISYT